MYTGHYGIALMGKGLRADVPLWVWLAAAFGFDLFNLGLALADVGGGAAAWAGTAAGAVPMAAGAGLLAYWALHDGYGAGLVALVTLLHVPVDLATNKTALWPGGPRVGAALYQHPVLDAVVEILIVAAGWWLYRRTLPQSRRSAWLAWAVLAGLIALQIGFNLSSDLL